MRAPATPPYNAASGINNRDIHDAGRYQKAGSCIRRSHFESHLQNIWLERRKRAIERPAKLRNHAFRSADHQLARRRISEPLAELLDQRLLRHGKPAAAGAVERLIDIGKIENMGSVNDR